MCVGSLITWRDLNCEVMLSIAFPSVVDLLDLALKSPIATTTKGFLWTIFLKFNSRFLENVSKSSIVWLGDL